MLLSGRVLDKVTQLPLPQTTIQLIAPSGQPYGFATKTANNGSFYLDSPLNNEGMVLVAADGFQSELYQPSLLTNPLGVVIRLEREGAPDTNLLLPLTLAGVAVAIAISNKQKKNTIGEADVSNYVLPLGLLGIVYFGGKWLLTKLGILNPEDDSKEAADKSAADEQQAAGKKPSVNNPANRNFSDNDLKSIATQLTDSTNTYWYDYETMVMMMAYWAGFRNADAVKFLSLVVDVYGGTLYKWYREKFNNASNLNGRDIYNYMGRYAANFRTMGFTTIGGPYAEPDNDVKKCIAYVYKVAGMAMT